jgi:hypothetical protein
MNDAVRTALFSHLSIQEMMRICALRLMQVHEWEEAAKLLAQSARIEKRNTIEHRSGSPRNSSRTGPASL